jgi:hypothetical protein
VNGVYGLAVVVGLVALLGWIALTAVAANVDGWEQRDPERWIGPWGRRTIAAIIGFGMAGLSTSFAGWPAAAGVGAAAAGAVGLALLTEWLAPDPR